ncbi:unnamed protein product [Sympodiomycopsis kandeliae]
MASHPSQWQYPNGTTTFTSHDDRRHSHNHQNTGSSSASPPTNDADESRDSVEMNARRDPPRKRNRAALSCVACRERKIKCNRQIPCDQCTKRGDQELCFLDPYKRGPPAGQSKSAKVQAQLQAQAEQQAARDARMDETQGHHHQQHYRQSPQQAHASHRQHPIQSQPLTMPSFPGPSLPPVSASSYNNGPNTSSSTGHSDAEFAVIKARLAQLEAVLANSSHQQQGLSPPIHGARSTVSPGSTSNHDKSPGMSFASNMNMTQGGQSNNDASRWTPSGQHLQSSSTYANQFAMDPPQAQYPHQQQQPQRHRGRSGSPPAASTPGQRSTREGSDASRSDNESRGAETHKPDSDTEDAAMVLEGLAMSGQESRKGGKGNVCTASGDGATDVVVKEPKESLMGYVARNRQTDIMLDVSQGGTSGATAQEIEECSSKACGGKIGSHGEEARSYEDLLQLEKNGVDVSPAEKVCKLIKTSSSIFRPVFGPESLLGFGMGWAFAAAEAAKDLHVKGGECPGSAQREAVLRAIIRSLPRREIADQLVSVYGERVNFLSGNVVHMPTLIKEVDAFYALETVEKRARVINNVDPGWLALFLLVITLALRFYPCTPPDGWLPITHLFDGRSIHLYASAARTALILARYQSSQSLAVLQAILLSTLSDSHAGRKYNQTMLRIAISNAQEMGLHLLGDKSKQPRAGESKAIVVRREIAKRIWYQLVFKDWSGSVCSGTYSVQDKQFNTPLPGNYNDEDLEKTPLPPPHPREKHTEMSYSLESIEIVKVMKLHTDILAERKMEKEYQDSKGGVRLACADASHLDAAYRNLLDNLPSFFAVGSETGTATEIEIQRWLLQQSVFHHLLRLHRPQLSTYSTARTSCVALARSILDTQKKLRSRCTVIDRLMCNLAQSYTAAIVLLLDLLQHGHEQPAGMRTVIRSEVAEAIRALHHVNETTNSTEAGIRVLEALLAEEDSRWRAYQEEFAVHGGSKRKRGSQTAPKRKELLSLAMRIARAAKCESQCSSQEEQVVKDRLSREQEQTILSQMKTDDSQQEANKDALSRALMEQLLVPANNQMQKRYHPTLGAASSGDQNTGEANSSSSLFGNPASNNALYDPSTLGPNGVEGGGNLFTSGDGTGFDLDSFLARYDSPGSSSSTGAQSADDGFSFSSGASSSGYATSITHPGSEELNRSNSYSSSGSPVDLKQHPSLYHQHSNSSSISNGNGASTSNGQGQGASAQSSFNAGNGTNHSPPSASSNVAVDQSALGLDAFYNWVLSQGLNPRTPGPSGNVGQASNQQQQMQHPSYREQQTPRPHSGGNNNAQHQPMHGLQSQGSSGDLMQQDPPTGSFNKNDVAGSDSRNNGNQGPNSTSAAGMTYPSSVASGFKAVEPYYYLAPFGGPPQNVWPSQAAGSSSNDASAATDKSSSTSAAAPQQSLGASTYNDVTSTGLTPLPSSLNMGTPSADAGGATNANFNNTMSGWLNGPGLFDW